MRKRKISNARIQSILNDEAKSDLNFQLRVSAMSVRPKPKKRHYTPFTVQVSKKPKKYRPVQKVVSATAREKRVRQNAGIGFSFSRSDSFHANCKVKHKSFSALIRSKFIKGGAGRGKKWSRKKTPNRSKRQYC